MAVLADPRADDIGRLRKQPVFVRQAGLQWAVNLFARNQPKPAAFQPDQSEEVLLKIAPKRLWMIGIESQVFVHMKGDNPRPVDVPVGYQSGQELILTRSRGKDEVGLTGHMLAFPYFPRDSLRRCSARQGSILEHENLE
jgi:hypothetical protein